MKAKKLLKLTSYHKSHWGQRIIAAELDKTFTSSDHDDSLKWQTCVCGGLDPRIPKHTKDFIVPDGEPGSYLKGSPVDKKLNKLGDKFYDAITDNNYLKAAVLLVKIENRAIRVLQKLGYIK